MTVRVLEGRQGILDAVGTRLGVSDWVAIDQERIDRFAKATGDLQWIHVDRERATQGPFGGTIAHGFLVLSLIPVFASSVFTLQGTQMAVNYGLNRVRFPAPTPSASRIRAAVDLTGAAEASGGLQLSILYTVQREDSERAVCVAENLVLAKFAAPETT